MGKKSKKTRWRTFALNGHQSDSEESSTPSSVSHQNHRNYHNKYYNSKFTYSSQSTPIRRYQNDSSKTTRSNSTTSEHKTTFNEDEYTRITTPRQDVLFKKGYLNKPKNYQTQTSTGTSSTANSTSTCTPDHQSADGTEGTDMEYESQFVFPNGFIDQNGIYYINSYEPFPFVVYNAPLCYPEYPLERTKRYSTDSAVESASPQNEEVVQNGFSQSTDYYYLNNNSASDNTNEEPRRIKKKRRRKVSQTKDGDTSCDTDSSDVFIEPELPQIPSAVNHLQQEASQCNSVENDEGQDQVLKPTDDDPQISADEDPNNKCPLKPDAEEFIPRTFQVPPDIPFEPNKIQYVNFTPSYIPVPYINHNPTFLPPGIPINYVPIQDPKFVNVIVPSANETNTSVEEAVKVPEITMHTEPSLDQNAAKKAPIDIARIVTKLEEAVVEQNKREQHQFPLSTHNRKGRYHYQKSYHTKPSERSKIQQVVAQTPLQNNIVNHIRSKPNNYSAMVKKKFETVNKPCIRYEKSLESAVIKQRPVNQWISVSSRKKKRKGVNEQEDSFEELDNKEAKQDENEDLFESFDVNLLEDVVPVKLVNDNEEGRLTEDIVDSKNELSISQTQIDIKLEPKKSIEISSKTESKEIDKIKEQKKKTKVAQKHLIKRIIIKDDLQQESCSEDIKTESPRNTQTEIKVVEAEVTSELEPKSVENVTTSPIDKKKKKKKKVVKLQSISSSSTTLSNFDDSYDFLLENSILEDSEQKTNVEMSEAFDFMIQKGMYNILEEKMKSLNIGANEDGFFRTDNFGTFKMPSTPSKHIFAPPQFDKLFQQDFLKSDPILKPSTSAIFLENPTVTEIIKNVIDPSMVHIGPIDVGHQTCSNNSYPITQAVKNWLTKTRENTPDVELLKSPNTIYKELSEEPAGKNDDEVTLWSVSPRNSQGEDIINCLESDLQINKSSSQKEINGYHNGHIEEGEDVIEIYESKYGKNEDYLQLKAEVEEQQKTARNFPRHGNLPYRAICCNIM